jgi:hypothetical protein
MSALSLDPSECSNAPRLRLVARDEDTSPLHDWPTAAAVEGGPEFDVAHDALPTDPSRVLVAGRDPAKRTDVLDSLSEILPLRTLFEQAGTFWEVLARAPASRMVILSGEIDGIPAESLLHMLGHRHPGLPVVSLEVPAPHAVCAPA